MFSISLLVLTLQIYDIYLIKRTKFISITLKIVAYTFFSFIMEHFLGETGNKHPIADVA